jgi:hypothetical protein
MGAYENPKLIQNTVSSEGAGWANLAANVGGKISQAIIARKKYLEAELEKENKEALQLKKQWSSLINQGEEALQKNLERVGPLDKAYKKAYSEEFRKGWKAYSKLQISTDPSEIEELQKEVDKFNSFKSKAPDQITSSNEYQIKMQKFLSQAIVDGAGIPGTVDLYFNGNNNLLKAASIEAGGITKGEGRKLVINENGDSVLKYTFIKDGKEETFDLNTANLDFDKVLKVPDLNKNINNITKNIYNEDGELNSTYAPRNDQNQPDVETITKVDEKTGEIVQITSQKYNKEAIVGQYVNAAQDYANPLTRAEKVSMFNNIIKPKLGPDYKETLTYKPAEREKEGAFEEIFDSALSAYAGKLAEDGVSKATEKYYKQKISYIEKDKDNKSVSDKVQNSLFLLKTLAEGKTIMLPGDKLIEKQEDGTYRASKIGSQYANKVEAITYNNIAGVIKSGIMGINIAEKLMNAYRAANLD